MISYKKYELMKECLFETFKVYASTLDTSDYVPTAHLEKTHKWILKTMKKKQREIAREDRRYQRSLKKIVKSGVVVDTTSKDYVLGDIVSLYNTVPVENVSGENVQSVKTEEVNNEQKDKQED